MCGDDPGADYRQVPAHLRQLRGPYTSAAAGTAAFVRHCGGHDAGEEADRPVLDRPDNQGRRSWEDPDRVTRPTPVMRDTAAGTTSALLRVPVQRVHP
jgi:hypothetical protein